MRNTSLTPWLLLCVGLSVALPASGAEPTAAEISRRSREQGALNMVDLEARLELVTSQGEKVKTQKLVSAARRIGGRLHTVTRFTDPSSVAGVAVLSVEGAAGQPAAISMYLPKLRRVRKVASSQRGDAFMQTDLSYADLMGAGAVADKELTREADDQVEGRKTFVLRAKPGDDSPYGEVKLWVDQETFVPLRIAYSDRAGKPLKRYRALSLAKFEGRTYAAKAVMENLQTGSTTRVEVSSLQRSAKGDAAFTERALERG